MVVCVFISSLIKLDCFVVSRRSKKYILRAQGEETCKLKLYPFNYVCKISVKFFPSDFFFLGTAWIPISTTSVEMPTDINMALCLGPEFMLQALAPEPAQAIQFFLKCVIVN